MTPSSSVRDAHQPMGYGMIFAALAAVCAARADDAALTVDEAVHLALARNRALIAAKLDVNAKRVDEIEAGLRPNPELSYGVNNLILGRANDQERNLQPNSLAQTIHNVTLEQTFDIFAKRRAKLAVAKQHTASSQLWLHDAVRELVRAVRTAFADVVREQTELALAQRSRKHWDNTVVLMQKRHEAGELAGIELDKVVLEGQRSAQVLLEAELQLTVARHSLAEALGYGSPEDLPPHLAANPLPVAAAPEEALPERLVLKALGARPDLRAVMASEVATSLDRVAQRRAALFDLTVGLTYQRSHFQISGDNPHSLGLSLRLPLPLVDRNQPGRRLAQVQAAKLNNEVMRLRLVIEHEVRAAVAGWKRAQQSLDLYESGGLVTRARSGRDALQRAFAAGHSSLLEVLEAERTSIEVEADFLRSQDAMRQALITIAYVTAAKESL